MPMHSHVSDASDFEPSTLTADFDAELELDGATASVGSDPQAVAPVDFAEAFGPVASRWEAMLRWYEMTVTAPAVTH